MHGSIIMFFTSPCPLLFSKMVAIFVLHYNSILRAKMKEDYGYREHGEDDFAEKVQTPMSLDDVNCLHGAGSITPSTILTGKITVRHLITFTG